MASSAQALKTGKHSNNQTTPAGWDKSPIDFSGLNSIKADLAFSAKSLVARDITMGPVQLAVKVDNGQLTTALNKIALYQGKGNGQITVDARTKPAKLAAKFALSDMNMRPFLTDTIGMRNLSGKGGVTLDLTAQGASQAAIIRQLNGTSKLEMRDGQINGINIPTDAAKSARQHSGWLGLRRCSEHRFLSTDSKLHVQEWHCQQQ